MSRCQLAYRISFTGYFGLFALMMLWLTWLSPPENLPVSLALIFMVGPLLLPLRGLLHGRPYTFAWAGFIALLYLLHGTVEAYSSPEERHLAALEIVFGLMFFFGGSFYARWKSQEAGNTD